LKRGYCLEDICKVRQQSQFVYSNGDGIARTRGTERHPHFKLIVVLLVSENIFQRSRNGKEWVIGLDQSKSCGFSIVEIKRTDPNFDGSFWSIAGYASEHPDQPELSCLMI
jgi:hypothetical protein